MKERLLILFLTILSCCPTQASDYLFKKGYSNYSIVLSAEASKSERTAAKELQKYIKEVSGATLSVFEGTMPPGKNIFIGYNQRATAFCNKKQYDDEDEGFTYKKVGHDLIIYGGRHRGTMYGVFSFLENTRSRKYSPMAAPANGA